MWSSQDEHRARSLYQKCEKGNANDAVISQNLDILPLVLGHACIGAHLDIVRMLLRHDFDLDRKANDAETPLFIACTGHPIRGEDATRIVLANGAAWDRVTRIGVTLVSYVRGRRNRSGGRELNQIFDEFFTKYWMLRLRLRVVGRRSVAQQRVLGDLYLSNHLASFVIGDGVLSSRPAS